MTSYDYQIYRSGVISLDLYNVVGQHIRTLASGFSAEGRHTAAWNGIDTSGNVVTSGLYIVHLRDGSQTVTHSILLMK
ncbi:FlgD immunoglobulin-like domain containing protein [Candidatus Latescibacterota bacterium]